MTIRRLLGLATAVVLATLRLLWRRRLLVVVVVLLGLLLQHFYCRSVRKVDPPCCCLPPGCTGSGTTPTAIETAKTPT